MTVQAIGWAIWTALCALTIVFVASTYAVLRRKGNRAVTVAVPQTTLLWYLLLGWTVSAPSVNKVHLLWLAVTTHLIALIVNFSHGLLEVSLGRPVSHRTLLLVQVVLWVAVLWSLTPGMTAERLVPVAVALMIGAAALFLLLGI